MAKDILIGIDAGTSVIKSVAFSGDGQQLAVAAIANHYVTHADGGAEQDMARTWADAAATLKQLSEKIPNLSERLIAIAVTGQGDGMWLIDEAGEPVAPAWLWLDARAKAIVDDYTSGPHHAAHYARTGTGVNVCQAHVQLAWMQKYRPDILARATTCFHCKDWIYFKLTGTRATDLSEGNFTFGNFAERTYHADILDQLGAPAAKRLLPAMIDGTVTCDGLSNTAAALCGLNVGTPIILGSVDVLCTGLGGGLFDSSGQTGCTIVGSTGMHMRLKTNVKAVQLNTEKSGYTMVMPVPEMVAQIQSNMASTLNIDWLLDLGRDLLREHGVERTRAQMLEGLDDKLLAVPAAQVVYHPYISKAGERGPFMEPAARAMVTGLDGDVGYYSLLRGVFEGLGYAARDCYQAMGDVPGEVRLTGGAARSKALRIIFASILNCAVRPVSREEAGAAGAAMMAAVQQKLYPDMATCAAQWVTPYLADTTEPDRSLTDIYNAAFARYVATRKAMRPVWRMPQ